MPINSRRVNPAPEQIIAAKKQAKKLLKITCRVEVLIV
jgi:hypothetical protein